MADITPHGVRGGGPPERLRGHYSPDEDGQLRAVNTSRDGIIADKVQRAGSLWARSRGLLGRKGLEPGEGLLLDPCSGIHTWGMAFPIDAVFLSREGTVVHLIHQMVPWRMSRYLFKARSVLELPAGTLQETGIQLGDRLIFEA